MSLQILENSDLNKVSETVKTYLSDNKLNRGEVIKFKLLTGHKNTDKEKNGDEILLNSAITILLSGFINDPEKGAVEFGLVKSINPVTKLPVFKKYHVYPKRGNAEFILRGDVVEDIQIYDYLLLSNNNKSNPFRDKYAEEIFEKVNEVAESKVRSKKRNFLFDSLDAIRRWTPEDMRIAAAANNLSTQFPIDVLKDKLEEIAEKDPETFYKTIDSEDNLIKALIKMSQEASIIAFNAHENKWFYTGSNETVALLDRKEGVSALVQLTEFLKNSANGPAIKGNLQKLLKAAKSKNNS